MVPVRQGHVMFSMVWLAELFCRPDLQCFDKLYLRDALTKHAKSQSNCHDVCNVYLPTSPESIS